MKVDDNAVEAIIIKVNRAHEHFTTIKGELDAWNGRKPYRLVPEVHANGAKHFLRVQLLEPIRPEWSVWLGEAIHDLRSALDQVVYQLSIEHMGRPLAKTQFPIFSKRKKFAETSKKFPGGIPGSGLYQIRGLASGPHAFIEALQPYPQRHRRSVHRSLASLHDLWNQDKHRLVHLWGLRFTDAEVSVHGALPPASCLPYFFTGRVLHDGAIAIKIACDPPREDVQVGGPVIANIAIQGPGRGHGALSLWDLYGDVANVVAKLIGGLNRPTESIDIDAWHPRMRRL